MVKRLIVFVFSFLSFLLLLPSNSYAQESTFTTSPPLAEINDFLSTVTVTFEGQEFIDNAEFGDYYVCLEQDLCIDDKDIRKGIFEGNIDAIGSATGGLTEDEVDENTIERFKLDEANSIIVCGDGDSKLKTPERFHGGGDDAKSCAGGENGNDNNEKDYFHAGNVYMLSVYQKVEGDLYILRSVAGFYVNHGNPEANISPKTNLTPGGKFTIDLTSPKIRNAGNGDKKDRNNYQIIISGPGMKNDLLDKIQIGQLIPGNNERCVSFLEPGASETIELPLGNSRTLTGDYVIKIREQVQEKNDLDKCLGGFTYMEFHCTIGGSESDPALNVCTEAIIDPDKKDITTMAQLFRDLGLTGGGTALPCSEVEGDLIAGNPDASRSAVGRPEDCKTLETAIGPISLDPGSFILSIFNYVLGIAGFAALVLIIYGGYNYMISRGDPEKIKHAREIITAAIIGLLFIIFSFVILQVIAGDILRIPGFNKPETSNETGVDRIDDGTVSGTEFPPNP